MGLFGRAGILLLVLLAALTPRSPDGLRALLMVSVGTTALYALGCGRHAVCRRVGERHVRVSAGLPVGGLRLGAAKITFALVSAAVLFLMVAALAFCLGRGKLLPLHDYVLAGAMPGFSAWRCSFGRSCSRCC